MKKFNPRRRYRVAQIKEGDNKGKFKLLQRYNNQWFNNQWFNIWILCQKKWRWIDVEIRYATLAGYHYGLGIFDSEEEAAQYVLQYSKTKSI